MADQDTRTGGGGSPQVPASLAELQRTTDEITRMLHELRAAQSSQRSMMLLGSLIIVMVMLGFGWFTYVKVSDNLTKDKLQAQVTEQAKVLLPQLEANLKDTLHEVLPFYLKLGKERLSQVRPKLEAKLKEQADKMPAELREGLGKQIDERFTRITEDATKQLSTAFPAIGGDSGRHATEQLRTALATEGQKLRDHVMELASAEMTKANATMQRFPVPDVSNDKADDLVRRLLHNLIMLADYEILATDAPPSLDRSNLKKDIPLGN